MSETTKVAFELINKIEWIQLGGLADEVDDRILQEAFNPFGETNSIQMPLDYVTG